MDNNKKGMWLTLGFMALIIGGIFAWTRTNTQKIIKMADYELTTFRIHRVNLLSTIIKTTILVKNPSDMAINLKSFRVEILRVKGTVKKVLATSPTTALVIPANGNIAYNIDFTVDNLELVDLLFGSVKTGMENQLKGKIFVKIKADVLGQYIEKEIQYL